MKGQYRHQKSNQSWPVDFSVLLDLIIFQKNVDLILSNDGEKLCKRLYQGNHDQPEKDDNQLVYKRGLPLPCPNQSERLHFYTIEHIEEIQLI